MFTPKVTCFETVALQVVFVRTKITHWYHMFPTKMTSFATRGTADGPLPHKMSAGIGPYRIGHAGIGWVQEWCIHWFKIGRALDPLDLRFASAAPWMVFGPSKIPH